MDRGSYQPNRVDDRGIGINELKGSSMNTIKHKEKHCQKMINQKYPGCPPTNYLVGPVV